MLTVTLLYKTLQNKNMSIPSFEYFVDLELREMRNKNQTTLAPLALTTDERVYNKRLARHVKGNPPLLEKGRYAPHLRNWLKHYKVGNSLMVLNYDDFAKNTSAVYERLLDFVGLPFHKPPGGFQKVFSAYQKFPMANSTRRHLETFFAPYNAQLGDLLGTEWQDIWPPKE
jgi:hypothetical protein